MLVNAESVKKLSVVETNNTGKTDIKDPRVTSTLARDKEKKIITVNISPELLMQLISVIKT